MYIKLALIALVAILIWALVYFGLHWFHDRIAVSILIAIVGALIAVVVYWAIAKHSADLFSNSGSYIIAAAIGSAAFLCIFGETRTAPVGPPRAVGIWIDCTNRAVYSNFVCVARNDTVNFKSLRQQRITVQFTGGSPFNGSSFSAPIGQDIPGQLVTGADGGYYYTVSCDGTGIGMSPAPMIQIPRNH